MTEQVLLNGSVLWGARSYGDSDRDARQYGGSIGLKVQHHPRFATRLVYRYTRNDADASVFNYDANRFSVSGEVKAFETVFLTFEYALEVAERNLYQSATAPIPSGAHSRRASTTFGPNQVVLKADAVAHIFSVDWDLTIYKELYTLVGYSYSYVQSDPGDYRTSIFSMRIGYRF
jgi:hypothetical protein